MEHTPEKITPEEMYAYRLEAVDQAVDQVRLAAPGTEKKQATLRLEMMQRELEAFVEEYGTPILPHMDDTP